MLKKLFSKDYKKYTITTLIFALCSICIGVFFHFIYDLTRQNCFVGLFAPVNESIWEHLKLLFFPFVLTLIAEYFIYGKEAYNFFTSKLFRLNLGLLLIVTGYYTVSGAFGINSAFINIILFIISTLTAYVSAYMRLLKTPRLAGGAWEAAAIITFIAYTTLFMIFTYFTPHLPIFRDPESMSFSVG